MDSISRRSSSATTAGNVERLLVGRFHSLGDVILTTGIVTRLARAGARVEVATRAAFVPIFEGLPVARIWTPEELAESGGFDRVIDLQSNGTSRRLLAGGHSNERVNSRSIARRWTVLWGRRAPRMKIPHCVQRFAEAAGCATDALGDLRPRVTVTERDVEEGRELPLAWERSASPCVGYAPGASRAMKRWPDGRFRSLAAALETRGVRALRFDEPQEAVSCETDGAVQANLRPLKAILKRCAALVTNDSGMMHLAVALDVPVVAIFGSTVLDFGFGPLGDRDTVVERDLPCRPCAPHGARFCWQGHAGCLRGVSVEEVLATVLERTGAEVPR
jgi:ADP-heptose:LPS heptosyltransferase